MSVARGKLVFESDSNGSNDSKLSNSDRMNLNQFESQFAAIRETHSQCEEEMDVSNTADKSTGPLASDFDSCVSPGDVFGFDSGIDSPAIMTPGLGPCHKRNKKSSISKLRFEIGSPVEASSPTHFKTNSQHDDVEGSSSPLVIRARGSLPRPTFYTEEDKIIGHSSASLQCPLTPPSKRLHSLCLFDTPHTPKSLFEKAHRRINDRHPSSRLSAGQLLEGPQANTNPFTPQNEHTVDDLRSRSSGKGVKRSRDSSPDMDEASPMNKKMSLRNIAISRYVEEFHEIEKLGDGKFGSVYKCVHRLDGCTYAIKKSKNPVAGSPYESVAVNEVYAHAVLGKHRHVVRYFSAWSENDHMFIQNEYCNGGSLADTLATYGREGKVMTDIELRTLLMQLAHGLKYIHSKPLVHLDIKPANIFLHTSDGESDDDEEKDTICYKIGDFGHVTSVTAPEVDEGDARYMPKEFLDEEYDNLPKADIFSLALSIYQSATCLELPMNGAGFHSIRAGNLTQPSNMSDELHALLVSMIHPDPAQRPSCTDLLRSPILRPKQDFNHLMFENRILKQKLERFEGQQETRNLAATRLLGNRNGHQVNRSMSVQF